jgi:hypothetical protein
MEPEPLGQPRYLRRVERIARSRLYGDAVPPTPFVTSVSAGPPVAGTAVTLSLKTTFRALRRVSLCPWRIGAITAAALVLLHHQHGRTT